MHRKIFLYMSVMAASAVTGPLAGQTAPAAPSAKAAPKAAPQAKSYKPPRTPWGDPDLQGLWPGSVNIPLQRPASMGTRSTLT
jgi:hypothetical protein